MADYRVWVTRIGRAVSTTATALATAVTITEAVSGAKFSVHQFAFSIGFFVWVLVLAAPYAALAPFSVWLIWEKRTGFDAPRMVEVILVIIFAVSWIPLIAWGIAQAEETWADQVLNVISSVTGVLVVAAGAWLWFWPPARRNRPQTDGTRPRPMRR